MNQENYIFDYLDENKFHVRERSVRKYNMLAYKKLSFEYYPKLKSGEFLGTLVGTNHDHSEMYELELPTDEMFRKVHGVIKLHYTVFKDKRVILLTNITPDQILEEGHRSELKAYKGVMISKSDPKRDMFKVNLLSQMNKGIGSMFLIGFIVALFVIFIVAIILYFVV
ncbi:MAG: hypothetical protein PUB18_01010 [bacterium]|nr:hypothetical protein [bacterium]